MIQFSIKKTHAIVGLLLLLALIIVGPLTVFFVLTRTHITPHVQAQTQAQVQKGKLTQSNMGTTSNPTTPTTLISGNVPAFSSAGYFPASDANDDSYDTAWRSNGTPAWLAYDLSNVSATQRSKVLVVWYNESTNYDHTIINNFSYNMPEDYTLDVNSASGGANPPSTGWKTVVAVQANHYHSRQHIISMAGDNWIRISVTKIDGAPQNLDANINMDVYNANTAVADDWIFYGDSITALAMGHNTIDSIKAFAQLIDARSSGNYPVQEAGGTGFLTSSDALKYINSWLQLFPGKYVGLSYGTNDALGCLNGLTFYSNYLTMVQAALQAGKIPVIPHIPWGRNASIQRCGPALNAEIDKLYAAFPQIIKGPDLWGYFFHNQSLISDDNIHPTAMGMGVYRQLWANAMLAEVYHR
ncbi:MAG: SGNH/GDSL hydrolase family protein [Ktedonobacteraceae bacterium]